MQQTKWMTLGGTLLAVLSSTILYTIVIIQMLSPSESSFWSSPWLNFQALPVNADSILNDVGMMWLSGMARKIVETVVPKDETTVTTKLSAEAVNPRTGELIINSRAYEELGRSTVGVADIEGPMTAPAMLGSVEEARTVSRVEL